MIRIIALAFCCLVAFAAGRLTAPVGMLTLGSGAILQGPFTMTDACTITEKGAKDIQISNGRFERASCMWGQP